MPINILSSEVSSKIAAGEVIERPASIVKELIENSIDASASQIIIEARGGGVNYLRVSDNGNGISSTDMENICQRYATSKISKAADLETIKTLGFRGEALHSIAAVSEVQILTCTRDEEIGSYLMLKKGNVDERGNRACPPGTIITVRELFHHVPARLKFLKSTLTENEHILDTVSRSSLAFPEVRFTLFLDDRAVWRTSGNGNLRDVLIEMYGVEIAKAMIEVNNNCSSNDSPSNMTVVTGLVSPPEISRANRRHINFFINHRPVRSALLTRAIEQGYHGLLMTGRYPLAFINLSLPPGTIDVNVHPTKSEVRFSNEQAVFSVLQSAVHQVMAGSKTEIPSINHLNITNSIPGDQNSPVMTRQEMRAPSSPELFPSETSDMVSILRVIGQVANCYIIAEGNDGLYLIDQHAAHERVVFDKITKERRHNNVEKQGLLEPIILELTAQQEIPFNLNKDILALFGFTIEPFGKRTYLIRAIPATLQQTETAQVIREILDSLDETNSLKNKEEDIAISIACHGVIRAGQVLSAEETKKLVRQLEQTENPRTCPHGRPTMIHLSSLQIAKEFGRNTTLR